MRKCGNSLHNEHHTFWQRHKVRKRPDCVWVTIYVKKRPFFAGSLQRMIHGPVNLHLIQDSQVNGVTKDHHAHENVDRNRVKRNSCHYGLMSHCQRSDAFVQKRNIHHTHRIWVSVTTSSFGKWKDCVASATGREISDSLSWVHRARNNRYIKKRRYRWYQTSSASLTSCL
jgi:hypothetical protein